jgi:hypothetical protein
MSVSRRSKHHPLEKPPVEKLEIKDVHRRIAVMVCQENGMKTADISKATGVSLRQVKAILKRWDEEGSWEDRPRSGRPKTATNDENMDKVGPFSDGQPPAQSHLSGPSEDRPQPRALYAKDG